MIRSSRYLRKIYLEHPRLYTLCELCIVVGGIFLYLWVLRFWYWGPWFSAVMIAICSFVFIVSFPVHRDTLKDLGIRFDNLLPSLREASAATIICVAFAVLIFMFYRENYIPSDPMGTAAGFLRYVVWGTLQQFGLNSYLYLRMRTVTGNDDAAVIGAVAVFSLIHAPNGALMVFSGVGGLIFCYLFTRNRNIFSLGVMHGTLGMAALILFVPGLMKNPTVGPMGSERYDAYGGAALVCCGDVNGDGADEILISRGPAEESDSEVLVFSGDGALSNRFAAFDEGSRYGANLAAGDLDGDGTDEIIAARGPWHRNDTTITVLSGSGERLGCFTAFPGKRYGATVAAGDINGDGIDEIIAGTGPGQGYRPIIRVFSGAGALIAEFTARDYIQNGEYYQEMRHGVRVSSGDVDGDGIDEIVLAPPHVRPYRNYFMIIDPDGGASPRPSRWFCIYFRDYPHYGANLAAGDIDGNGIDEIVAGPGPHHRASADLMVLDRRGNLLFETFPFDTRYGLSVAAGDLDGDGVSEILATPGIGEERDAGVLKVLTPAGAVGELDLRPYFR